MGSHLTLLISILPLLTAAPFAHAQKTDSLTRIIVDWANRRKLASAVEYQVSGQRFFPKGCYTKTARKSGAGGKSAEEVPPADHFGPKKVTWLLHFENSWVRKHTEEERFVSGVFTQRDETELYDGQDFKDVEPREKNSTANYKPGKLQPDVRIPTKRIEKLTFSAFDSPVFFAHGIIPVPGNMPVPDRLKTSLKPEAFHLHGTGLVDGSQCVIVRASAPGSNSRVHEFWVDVSKQSAILRCRRFIMNRLWVQVDVRYKQFGLFRQSRV